MTVLKPIRSLTDAEVSPGDVIRWDKGARWAIVCDIEPSPAGVRARLRWAFGANAGEWVPKYRVGLDEGWVRLDLNSHALYRRHGKHSAKDRRNARTDIYAALGGVEARKILGES